MREQRRSIGGAHSLCFNEVLVRDRQPVQRAHSIATRLAFIESKRDLQCLLRRIRDDGVDRGIDALDLLEMRVEHITRRNFLTPDSSNQLASREEAQISG